MKIANLNSHQQNGTYHAWNKQYLYYLNAQITSLQDFITYNYPEYIIFNSPNTPEEQQISLTQAVDPYQIDLSTYDISLFFPSRLSWRQGFYNESNYGDGILMYPEEGYYVSYKHLDLDMPLYHIFEKKNDTWETDDVILSQYDIYKYITSTGEWAEVTNPSNYFTITGHQITMDSDDKHILIHCSKRDSRGAFSAIKYQNNQLICSVKFPVDTLYISRNNSVYVFSNKTKGWHDSMISTTTAEIKKYIDFPSGYICILNKRPVGEDNSTNSSKKLLNNYLIAPIGNGAFYFLGVDQSNLDAIYTPNELGNFINQVKINLGQNIRYIIPEETYIASNSFGIQNITIQNNSVEDNLTDHLGNVWTGEPILVGETKWNADGEEVFMDIYYSTDTLEIERHLVHSFNIHTTESVPKNTIAIKLF